MTAGQLTLYRGLAVSLAEADAVKHRILTTGIQGDEGRWRLSHSELRPRLATLRDKTDLRLEDTRASHRTPQGQTDPVNALEGFAVVCACGDKLGACYYATEHNRSDSQAASLLIEFVADIRDVWVDGRDFLYNPGFQTCNSDRQRDLLVSLFGKAVDPYVRKAMVSPDVSYRIAMCDLAVQDPDVVRQHYNNRIVMGGRHRTCFCSAFLVRSPVPVQSIISVTDAVPGDFVPQVTTEHFRSLA